MTPSHADTVMGKCQWCWTSAAETGRAQHLQHTGCLTGHTGPANNEILLFTHSFQLSAFFSLFFFACALIHPLTSAVITQTADKKDSSTPSLFPSSWSCFDELCSDQNPEDEMEKKSFLDMKFQCSRYFLIVFMLLYNIEWIKLVGR